jgi:hypothetical protein
MRMAVRAPPSYSFSFDKCRFSPAKSVGFMPRPRAWILVTVYFGLYKINTTIPPALNPNDAVKQFEGFGAAIKMQMQSGDIKEARAFVGMNGGYFITGDIAP